MNSKDRYIFEKILEYCDQLQKTRERLGGYENFMDDFLYQNAVCMCLLQIGELAGKLTQETREAMPHIPWRAIRGLRNVFAHDYGSIVLDPIWHTITVDVPDLEAEIRKAII